MAQPLLLTEAQACEATQLSRSTLRRLMAQGAIRPVRIGRSLRFTAEELARFVADLQTQPDGRMESGG